MPSARVNSPRIDKELCAIAMIKACAVSAIETNPPITALFTDRLSIRDLRISVS